MANVRIYVTTYCGYCHAAIGLLEKKSVPFEKIDCTNDAATRAWLIEQTGRRTVPQVFIDGVPVGGFDDLQALERAGELDPILAGTRQPASIV